MMKLLARSRPNAVCYKKKFNVLKMEVTIFFKLISWSYGLSPTLMMIGLVEKKV